MKDLITLNIDQATKVSGYAVMDDDNLITHGIIDISNKKLPILHFYQTIKQLISQYNPEVINWEDLKTDRNPDTIRRLGKMVGVLQLICEELDIKYNQYIPVSIKAKLCAKKTGKGGRGTKLDLAETLCNKYNLNLPYDEIVTVYKKGKNEGQQKIDDNHWFLNITDAIGIGLYHYKYGKRE